MPATGRRAISRSPPLGLTIAFGFDFRTNLDFGVTFNFNFDFAVTLNFNFAFVFAFLPSDFFFPVTAIFCYVTPITQYQS